MNAKPRETYEERVENARAVLLDAVDRMTDYGFATHEQAVRQTARCFNVKPADLQAAYDTLG